MNKSEEKVWRMTLGKLIAMYREYKIDHEIVDKKDDDVIPF